MELVALVSSGKGTWGQVAGLVKRGEWEKVYLVCPNYVKQRIKTFDFAQKAELFFFDFDKKMKDVIAEMNKKFKNKIQGPEVSLTIASGTGKEHMALISSLLKLPVGVRFVVLTSEGILEL